MLDRTDFASWQQRIRLYFRGKENGVNILKSIDEGPYRMGTVRETLAESTEGAPQFGPERPREYSDLTPEEKDRLQLNSKFVNNMLPEWGRFVTAVKLNRGLRNSNYDQPYAYLKQHETHAKENKMMLEHFSQSTVDHFALMSNVSNPQHYSPSLLALSYTQVPQPLTDSSLSPTEDLIENLANTETLVESTEGTPQFEWGRFVTAVKLNRGLRESNYDQLFTYLKQHEAHAKENKMVLERLSQPITQPTSDPLAMLSNVSNTQHGLPSSLTSSITPLTPPRTNSTDDLIENLTSTLALLTQSYRTFLPQTNNQLRTSSNLRNQAIVQDGRVVVQNGQARPSQARTAQENGVALDTEQLLFLAGGPDNAFDDDVDEQPV
nr:hypothetical protein [Tanacetum cinerariifolium]